MAELKCAERINGELESTVEYIRQCLRVYQGNTVDDPEISENTLFEYGLSFDYVPGGTDYNPDNGYFRWLLSWGGPADEIRYYADADKACHFIEYSFQDWFDGATREVTGADKAMLLEIYEIFNECGSIDAALTAAAG